MSLIPSESHSFPDNYSPVARSRRSQKRELSSQRPSEKPLERKIVSLPAVRETKVISPAPSQQVDEQFFQALAKMAGSNIAPPATEPWPKTILPAPIERVPRTPIAQPLSAANVDEASLLTPNGHGRAAQCRPRTPMRVAQSSPVKETTNGQPGVEPSIMRRSFVEEPNNDFDFTDLSSDVEQRARRNKKLVPFILIEFVALAILIPSAWLVLSRHVTSSTLVILLNILTITAAATIAIVPIILYAITPGSSRRDR